MVPPGGSETNDPSARRSRHLLSSSDPPPPPGATWGGGAACSPCALVQGARDRGGVGTEAPTGGLGTPSRYTKDMDPSEGVLTAGLMNCHATLVEGRQRGQNQRSQPWIITKGRNALGEDQRFGDEGLTCDSPHQEFQLLPG